MKKRFVSKKVRKKKLKIKFLLFILLFIISILLTFKYLLNSNIKINDKDFVKLILNNNYQENNIISKIINKIKKDYTPVNLLSTNYYELTDNNQKKTQSTINKNPIIYIYNSHQEEEYSPSNFVEKEVKPTVMMSSYIMKDVFDKNKLYTLVEERRIKDILNNNNWKYYKSYDVSRIYMEDSKKNNPTLDYFIDVHRDSLTRDKTTTEINNKSYAKIIFLVGLENPKYQENLDFTTLINNKLEELYPNLSKGIYKKGGTGVNGIYNQDNSNHTILVEIGGVENNTTEVLNSTLAFCEAFMEVITTNEG